MENYVLIAAVVILFFMAGFIVYLVTSSKQRDLESEIEHIDEMIAEKSTKQ